MFNSVISIYISSPWNSLAKIKIKNQLMNMNYCTNLMMLKCCNYFAYIAHICIYMYICIHTYVHMYASMYDARARMRNSVH